MPLFHVYKKEWCEYSENRGLIVKSSSWQRAKGIALAYWKEEDRNNIEVREHKEIEEGIICPTDGGVWNDTSYN
jgi:hypothetical protein